MDSTVLVEQFYAILRYSDPDFASALQRALRHLFCDNGCVPSTLTIEESDEALVVTAEHHRTREEELGLPGQFVDKDPDLDAKAKGRLEHARRREEARQARQAG